MLAVPGGAFNMGCTGDQNINCPNAELPTHSITLPGFQIGKYEVTQAEWLALMSDVNPVGTPHFPSCGSDCPIEKVSWYDAAVYCNRLSDTNQLTPCYYADAAFTQVYGKTGGAWSLPNSGPVYWRKDADGYRLPTEAEWEYAARGGSGNPIQTKYAGSDNQDLVAWTSGSTHPVGGKMANYLGTHDMSGNVWEWCWDVFSSDYYLNSPACVPVGPDTGAGRVYRGGSWYLSVGTRVAYRSAPSPESRVNDYGFRLAKGRITPGCPSLVMPTNASSNISPATPIRWTQTAPCTDGYFLSMGTTPGSSGLLDSLLVQDTLFNPMALLPVGQTIFARITPFNGAGNTLGCPEFSFSTAANPLFLLAPDTTVVAGASFCVPVTTAQFDSLVALQFSIGWDTAVIQYTGVQSFHPALGLNASNFGITEVNLGFLSLVWTTANFNGVTLPDSATMFQVCFEAVGDSGTVSPLAFGDFPTPPEAIKAGTFLTVPVAGVNGSVTISACNVQAVASADTLVCNGQSVSLSASGGAGYQWSGGGPASAVWTFTPAQSGVYTVTVTDAPGCTALDSVQVTVSPVVGLTLNTVSPAHCGQADGSVTATPSGGAMPFMFDWADLPGANDPGERTGIPAGLYSVTVTDANGCTASASGALNQIPGPSLSTTITPASCDASNGSIDLTVTSGTLPLQYNWSNAIQTEDLTGIPAGIYTVTVIDNAGCSATASATLGGSPAPVATASATQPVVCAGTGIQLTATGGASYAWSGPAAFTSSQQNPQRPNATAAMSGTYTVTVTAANGCTATATASLSVNDVPGATATVWPVLLCEGADINLGAGGGTGYSWTGPAAFSTTQQNPVRPNATASMSGTYTVTVSNTAGCTATATATVQVNANPVASASVLVPVLCETDSIALLASGGTAYTWTGPAGFNSGQQNPVLPDATTAMSGTYTVTVSNAQGCTAAATSTVVVLATPILTVQQSGVHCNQTDGAITLGASGPGGPFTFDWADLPGNNDPANRTGLPPGAYSVTVTGANGCTATRGIQLDDLGAPAAVGAPNPATCGQPNGAIDLILTNGTPPFQYLWSTGDTTQDIFGLPIGPYTVTITDGGGCTGITSTFLYGAAPLTATNVVVDCMGSDNQYVVSCTLTGGTPPYTLIAGNGTITGNQFTSQPVASGVFYSFGIQDSLACPPLLLDGLHDCNCLADPGTMDLTPIATCGPATVTAKHNQNQFLPPGAVLLFVLHQGNGTTLGNPIAWNTVPTFSFAGIGMPGQTYYISAIAGRSDGAGGILLSDPCLSVAPGTPVTFVTGYDYNVSAVFCSGGVYAVGDTSFSTPGNHTALLKTAFGCDSILHISLEMRQPVVILGSDLKTCANDTVTLSTQAINCAGCQYAWSVPGEQFASITVHPATTTTYSVTATDNAGCTAQASVQVQVAPVAVTELEAVICAGAAYPVGGLTFTDPGDYEVHLTSAAGCDSTVFLMLDVIDAKVFTAGSDTFFFPPGQGGVQRTYNVTKNDDPPGGAWAVSLLTQPQAGQAELSPEGRLTYRLTNTAFRGLDVFEYQLCDTECSGACVTASIALVVQDELVLYNDSLPNAFTPNDDGFNDTFDPLFYYLDQGFITPYDRAILTIVNRWGEVIWERDPYPTGGWDGTSGFRTLVPQGTYYYVLRMELGGTVTVKGTVQVLR